jgi:hypothetical protein
LSRYFADFGTILTLAAEPVAQPKPSRAGPVIATAQPVVSATDAAFRQGLVGRTIPIAMTQQQPSAGSRDLTAIFAQEGTGADIRSAQQIADAKAAAARQAQADADAAEQAQLKALQDQQRQAELDAAAAEGYAYSDTQEPSLFQKLGPWAWVGAAAGALALAGIGFAVTKKKSVAGYRRRSRR